MADGETNNLTQLTVDLLGAYVANNQVEHSDLAQLIQSTHAALKGIEAPEVATPQEPDHKPAVSLRKSLGSKSHIISMIDGKPYQTLKRHLGKHGLTPQQYRERFNLPKSYPMVAPDYSQARRAIAEKLGLGRKLKVGEAKSPAKPEDLPTDKAAEATKSVGRTATKAGAGGKAKIATSARNSETKAAVGSSAPAVTAAPKRKPASASKSTKAAAEPSAPSATSAPAKVTAKTRATNPTDAPKARRARKPATA